MRSISAKVTADVSVLKREMSSGGETVRRFGRQVKDTSKQASGDFDVLSKRALALEVQMGATRKATDQLVLTFAKTGDTTILKRINDQKKALRELQDARNLLPDNAAIDRAGQKTGARLAEAVSARLMSALPKGLSGAGGGAAAAAIAAGPLAVTLTTLLGASVAGAIIGGTAGLGVAGGLVAASRDAGVKASAQSLADFIGKEMEQAAAPFVPAAKQAMEQARADFQTFGVDIDQILAKASKFVLPLEGGGMDFLDEVLSEIPDLMDAAAPVIQVLSEEMGNLGDAVGDVLAGISDNGPAAAVALEMLFDMIADGVRLAGNLINGLAETFEFFAKNGFLGGEVQKKFEEYEAAQKKAASASDGLTTSVTATGAAAEESAEKLDEMNAATEALFNQFMTLDQAMISFADGQKKANKELRDGARTLALNSTEGRENRKAILDQIQNIEQLRKARLAQGDSLDHVNAKYQQDIDGLRRSAVAAGFSAKAVDRLTGKYRALPNAHSTQVTVDGVPVAQKKITTLKQAVQSLPPGNVKINVDAGGARATLAQLRQNIANLGGTYIAPGPKIRGHRHGGIDIAMAAGGITGAGIYPASNPPLVRYAEPETGGEAYVPKNGDRGRNLAILSEVARWPSVNAAIVPMDSGGIIGMAAGGLVNVDRSSTTTTRTGSRLDSEAAYIGARDAVRSLNQSLRENGRALSLSTVRGRENRQAVNDSIQAAKAAAVAKFDETGSVKQANAAYAVHLKRLQAVLQQQGINAQAARKLVNALAPTIDYGVTAAAPRNSSSTIAAVRDRMALAEASDKARTFFDPSWGKPTFGTGNAFGRDNLTALFEFLGAAEQAAQSNYTQTGSTKTATGLYNNALNTLRSALSSAGMSKKEIDALLGTYGRITLGNRYGGVYEHMATGGLREAHIAPAGPTRYAYAEPATGGELFAPKNGPLAKTRSEVGWAVQNWWGGQVTWQQAGPGRAPGGSAGPGGAMTIHVVVHDGQVAGLIDVRVDQQLGALADAQVYATTA